MPLEIGNAPAPLTITYRPRYGILRFFWDLGVFCFFLYLVYSRYNDPHRDWVGMIFPVFTGIGVVLTLLYRLGGRTQLEFSQEKLVVRVVIMGVAQQSSYVIGQMGEPYWSEFTATNDESSPHMEFHYNGRDVAICSGMTQAEADQVVGAIRGLYPDLARRWDAGTPLQSTFITTLGLV